MSERAHIHDSKGRRIPLLDGHGNLSAEAMALYVADALNAEDRAAVDSVADADEMTREALDGLTPVPVNHRAAFTDLNSKVAERTGTMTVVHSAKQELPWMRIAAGLALLLAGAGISYLVMNWPSGNEMASGDLQETSAALPPMEPAQESEAVEMPVFEDSTMTADEDAVGLSDELAVAVQEPVAVVKKAETPKEEQTSKVEERPKTKERPKDEPRPVAESKPTPGAATPVESGQQAAAASEQVADADRDVAAAKSVAALAPEPVSTDGSASRRAAKRELQAAAQAENEERKAEPQRPMPYDRADSPPRFPGGDIELLKFISRNRNYPENLKNDGVTGAVYVNFVIEADGKVSNVKVAQGQHELLDNDAMRVIRAMPRWSPGEHQGKSVRTTRTVIVRYE